MQRRVGVGARGSEVGVGYGGIYGVNVALPFSHLI